MHTVSMFRRDTLFPLFAPAMQRSGAGTAVLRHLLKKGLNLEFVVAKVNTKVDGLMQKFRHTEKYVTENTKTIRISMLGNRIVADKTYSSPHDGTVGGGSP